MPHVAEVPLGSTLNLASVVDFRVLGPLEVADAGALVDVGAGRQRALLALLVLHAREVLSTDRILDELWEGDPPARAPNAVQVYVSGLRKALEPDLGRAADARVLVTRAPGYVLHAEDDEVDARRFEALAARGRRQLAEGQAVEAAAALRESLALWRGPALADLLDEPFARVEATRLDELRLVVLEDRVAADLATNTGGGELAAELEGLVARYPLRERLWANLMLALYRAGRQADALRAYQRARQTLTEELGLEPGPELRRLETAILRQAPDLVPAPDVVSDLVPGLDDAPGDIEKEPDVQGRVRKEFREERKVLTALFADLVGSTALGEQLDPEEYRLVVDEAVARMVTVADDFGGTVVSIAGDGLLALFGAPVAHEDDPERAIRAGLRMIEMMADYAAEVARSWGVHDIAVRIGVNTGPAVLGPVGRGEVIEYTALGDAVNTAARFQSAARPGSVLVGSSTSRLARRLFEWGEVQHLSLKGKADPVDAIEVLGTRATPGAARGVEGMEADLVGRDRELMEASVLVDDVLAGRGGILLVTGEPGIGKSRLLRELRSRLEASSSPGGEPRWLEGRCISYGETLSYSPVQTLVRDWLGVTADHPELRVRVALRRNLGELFGPDIGDVAPALAVLLGLSPDPDTLAIGQASPDAVQRAMVRAVRRVVERLSADGPVVLAVEDLHWADAGSLRLLEELLALTDDAPVLAVLTGRPERDHPWWRLAELAHRELSHRTRGVVLDALPHEADAALLRVLVGRGTLPAAVEQRLLDAAEGNPFFLEELLRSLVDAGALVLEDGAWRFDHDVDLDIPETVEKVIVARIDRLEPDAHAVLAAAAVLGREFGLPLLEAVAGDVVVIDPLRELQRLGLVRETRRWPTPTYRFRHALIQEAVYRTLLGERRRQLHRAAATALEGQAGEAAEEQAALLARHFEEAGETAQAVGYHQQAGDAARRVSASAAAVEHYGRALALADSLGWADDDRRRVELLLGRAVAVFQLGDALEAEADRRRAVELAQAGGHTHLEAQLVHTLIDLAVPLGLPGVTLVPMVETAIQEARRRGDIPLEVGLLAKMSMHWGNQLRFDEGWTWADRALVLARSTGDRRVVASALDGCKMLACYLGRLGPLRELTAELEEILRGEGDLWYLQWALAEGAVVPTAEARWDVAVAQLEEACELNRRIGDRGQASHLLAHLAWVHRARGDYGRALELGLEAVTSAEELTHAWWLGWSEAVHGWTLLDLRAGAQAVTHLRRGLAAAERAGTGNYIVRCLGQLAWAHVLAGDPADAATALTRAEAGMATVRTPPGSVFLHGAHAYLAAARAAAALGEPSRGARLLAPIVDAAVAEGWKEALAYGSLVLGRCTGDPALAERALGVAEDAGLRGAAWEAHAVLGHRAEAAALIDELASTIEDGKVKADFVARAKAEIG
jgi:class 3 adenylate cyclase/DNA-binding SARP family transcriptional activator